VVEFAERTDWVDFPSTATRVNAADLLRWERGIAAGGPGNEIDSAERTVFFDVQAVSNTYTFVEGLQIDVPAQARPFMVEFWAVCQLSTGTAAAATLQGLQVTLNDVTAGTPGTIFGYDPYYVAAPTTTARVFQATVHIQRRFAPTAARRIFSIYARTAVATPTNWGSVFLLGDDAGISGTNPPMWLRAVSL
jgi:hypothetical protein